MAGTTMSIYLFGLTCKGGMQCMTGLSMLIYIFGHTHTGNGGVGIVLQATTSIYIFSNTDLPGGRECVTDPTTIVEE